MFCPQCETEYREGITRCADCDVALVNELAPSAYDEALTPLADSIDPFTLSELTDRLEKAGVPYIVEAGTALGLLDHPEQRLTAPADWQARVWVASEFSERAQRVYTEILDRQRAEKLEHSS
ncbi:MAG TPA: hypothetical protein VF381_06765 [Thermoanaerobaculia bacterium]